MFKVTEGEVKEVQSLFGSRQVAIDKVYTNPEDSEETSHGSNRDVKTKTALKGDTAMSPEPSLTARTEPSTEPSTEPGSDPATDSGERVWKTALADLRLQLPRGTYDAWVRDACLAAVDGDVYTICAPSPQAAEWLKLRLTPLVEKTIARVAGRPTSVLFIAAYNGP